MLLIPCPHCGPRDEIEFRCGGESHIARPNADSASDQEWTSYLFYRQNPRGVLYERWHHLYGCRQWFNVARDTTSHDVLAIYAMTDPKPAIAP